MRPWLWWTVSGLSLSGKDLCDINYILCFQMIVTFSDDFFYVFRRNFVLLLWFFLKANCPTGCPCENYECESTVTTTVLPTGTAEPKEKAILVLHNTDNENNVPVVINLDGKSILYLCFCCICALFCIFFCIFEIEHAKKRVIQVSNYIQTPHQTF